jgi:hypothetical protein
MYEGREHRRSMEKVAEKLNKTEKKTGKVEERKGDWCVEEGL